MKETVSKISQRIRKTLNFVYGFLFSKGKVSAQKNVSLDPSLDAQSLPSTRSRDDERVARNGEETVRRTRFTDSIVPVARKPHEIRVQVFHDPKFIRVLKYGSIGATVCVAIASFVIFAMPFFTPRATLSASNPNSQFKGVESPSFTLDTAGFIKIQKDTRGTGEVRSGDESITASVTRDGKEVEGVEPIISSDSSGTDKFKVELANTSVLKPGKYNLAVKVQKKTLFTGKTVEQDFSQDFSWGVLALNPDKATYSVGETSLLAMAVLTDTGGIDCSASLTLQITDPTGATSSLSTEDGGIVIADTCSDHRLGLAPDYSANYKVAYPGTYKLSLHAETFNGTRDITDGFIADNAVDFQITRDAPTRIYPPLYYPTKITVTASKSFTGTIEETVPASFDIKPGNFNVAQYGQSKMLTWNVSLATGETTVLKYEWKAPDISPEFYVVGPLKFIESSGSNFTLDSGDVVFVEARQWQIASDAAYTCTTTATSGNWSTISWSGCNSSYPGASTANTYSAAINSTATTTIYLNLTPAMSLTTLTIIGNGYAHTLNLFTSAGVGNSLTTTSTVTISAPTSSLTNTIAVGNGSLTTGGNVAITAGTSSGRNSTLSVGNATYGAGSLNVTGNITLSGTGTATLSTLVSGSTVTMNNGTISGAKTVSFVAGSTFTTSGTSTIGGAYTFGGNFAVSDGTTTIGAYLMTVTGTSSITGDLTASSNTGVKTFTGKVTINDGGGVDFSARTFNMTITGGIENDSTDYFKTSTGTVTFSASQEFSGSGPITISGASSISAGFVITNNCTGAVTFTGTVTGGSTSSGITTGLNSDTIILSTAANFLSTGVLTPYNGVNTIEYNYAGAQTIKAETTNDYYNLVLGGSGTKTWVTGVTAIDGDFIMNGTTTATTLNVALTVYGKLDLNQTSTGSLTTAGYALTVNGVTEIAGGTLSLANATGAKTLTGMVTLSGGTLSGSSSNVALGAGITNDGGTVNLTGTVTMSTAGATFSGANNIGITTLTVTSPGTVTNNGTVTLAGNFTGTGSWTQGESSTLNVAGSAANALAVTTFTATATSNLVNYNATGAQTVKAATYYNLTMNATTSRTVSFPNNSTTTVNGTWQANGAASNLITLTRVSSGSWTIAPAAANVSYANVSYSNASTDICAQYSTDGGNNNSSWKFSAGTSCSTLTVGTTGSQTANMSIPSTNNYVGGAFTMSTDTGSATVSSIKISEMGTVAANTNLANAKLYYETAGTCSYDGTESLLGSVQFDSSQQATFTQTFGTNGMVTVTPGETNYNDDLYATAIDSQGNLYAVGDESGDNHNGYDWAIRKYSANGVLDTSFGTSGLVSYDTTAVSGSIDSAYAIAIDTSDNLYVAGAVEPSSGVSVWAIRKYTSSGTLVTGFGSSGMVTYGAYNNNDDTARAIIIDSSNNIYVGGEYYYNWVIRKYTSAGALVTAFGSSGTISSDFGYDDIIHAMTMDSSKSNFYVVGSSSDGISNYWRIAEYTTGGVLVTGFGSSGYVTYDGGGTASDAYAVAIDSSNNLYVAGTQATNGIDWAIRKYTSAGGVVSGFGSSGLVTYNSSGTRQDIAHAITIDSSSNIYVGGSSQNGTNTDWTIRKYTSDGGLATGFGSSGTVTYNSGYQDGIMAIAIDSSSNIYAGGYLSDSNEYYYWAIRKYNSNGVLFDSSGGVTVGTSQVCFYVVLDVGSGASNGQTLEIEITNPSVDISVTGAANTQTSAVAIAGTTNIGAASGISISGTTNLSSGTVAVAIGSTLQSGKTGTIGAGIWVIAGVTTPASGDVITVWVSGSPLSTAATTYDGSGDVDGMALNSHVLSIGNTDNRSLTVSNLGLYDRDNDTNIIHTANSSVLNVDAGNNFSDEQLNILSGNTLTVSGTETVTTHDLSNNGNLTSTGASTYNVSGSWYNNGMTGNFARSTSTVNFTSTTTETVSGFLESSSSFYQVSFNGVGGSWTITDSMTTTATTTTSFVIGNGTVTFGNSNTDALEVDGTMSVAATAGQTGTFQTTPLPAGQVIYVDINNSSQPDCANCKIIVGADSGGSGSPLSPITSTAAGDGMVATDYDTWSAVHGATSGSVAQGSYSYVQPGTWVSGGTYQIARFFAPFANPGGLSGKTITAATITLTQTDTYPSGFGTVNDLFVTADSQASSSGLVVGDYDTLGDTKFSDAINFSAVDTPQTFNLNAAGIAYLNAHKGDASLMLGLRHKADIENVAPSSDGGREIYTANFGTASYRPKLTLTVADPEGQGTFSLQKNTVLRLIPGSSSTSTSIEVKSTGNLNIAGAQETTGTSNGTTNETTLTDTSKNWTTNAYRYATVRMTSGNAKGKTYSITANTATTITRDSNASADVQISSISGSGSTRKICSADTSLSAYNNEYVGSYLNDKTGTTGYLRIVSSTAYDSACSSHNSFTVVAEPSAFSVLATNDYFAISDGVMAGDSFEVVNYAAVTSNDGASCGADTSDELSSYIYAGPGSQLSMNYAYVCNLGDSSNYVRGIDIENINGANANEGASIQNSVIMSNGYVGVYFWNVSNSTISGNEFKNSSDGGIALANSVSNTVTSNRVSGFWTSGISTYPSGSHTYGNMIAFNEIYSSSGSGIYTEEDVIGNTFVSNKVYGNMVGINLLGATQGTKLVSNVIYGNTSDGIVSSFSSASKVTFSSNQIYSNTGAALYLQGDTGTTITAIKDSYGVSGINASGDIVNNYSTTSVLCYDCTMASTTEVSGVAGAYVVSFKHDDVAGSTKIWGDYSIPNSDISETPQTESTNKFNYASNLWEKSITAHSYSGTGTEDTNLDYSLTGATLSGGPYTYQAVAQAGGTANCAVPTVFTIYRNGTATGINATCGTTYTDTLGSVNVSFKIDGGATAYVAGDSYTFTVWDADNSTSVTKSIAMMQDGDILTAPSGSTLELQGDATHITTVSRGGSGGYHFAVAGTINANYYKFSYLGGTGGGLGLDLQSTATVTNLANGTYDNYQNVGSADTYIRVHSNLIGTGSPTKTFANLTFLEASDNVPEYTVTESGGTAPATGYYWQFDSPTCTGWADCESSDSEQNTTNGGSIRWATSGNNAPNSPASLTQKTSPGGVSITEASWTNDYTPDLGFTITDPDSGNTVKYEVQVDNTDSSFANLILDYTHGSLLASGTTFAFTIGSYGSGSCTGTCPSGLSDSSTGYWWRVRAIDDSAATSGWSTFGVLSTVDYKVDVVAPTGTISINAGATYTNSTSVTLALSGDDTGGSGLSQMRFSNDGSTWPEGWVTYSTSHAWTLAANDGSKTVYAQFMDAAGNTSSLSSAITLRGFGDYANGTTSLSLAQPSGTATGDVLIAYVMDKATSGTTSGPTGWTRAAGAAGTNGRYQAFVAVIGQGGLGSSPWTFTGLTSESAGIIIGYYGVDASTPMDVTGSARYNASGGGTTSITPVTNGNRIVLSHVGLTNNYSWSAMSVANGPTLTEEYDDGDVHSVSIWDATQTTAGATGAASGTGAGGAASVGILLSLRPASGASDSIIYDGTAPTGLTVYDGSSVGVDAAYNDGSLTILHANWTAADFNISGPATPNRYQYAIGTTAGGTNIKTWTSVDTNSATTDSSLSLSTALTYYYTVKATDLAGNVATVSSDGQMVLPVLSVVFTNSPQLNGNANSVDLGIWQSPSYSGTGTTQITTTTNASSGYAVYMYKTADLTLAGGGATVLNISASYSSPILWATACPSGTACFGYTSNDVSVAGSNRYANGANYCAISGTAPGDIVMDDSSPQTSGQSYTVTYKVQTNSLQKAGTYSTGIQYSIVPQY